MSGRAFVVGAAGPRLSDDERSFFREADPFGLIVFRRNVEAPDQLRALCAEFRDAVGRADAPVLVDQEGGRVQRLRPPHWRAYPPARTFAQAAGDLEEAADLVRLGARLIAHDLRAVGITVDCMPVLDVPVPGAHDVVGDRAYGRDPDTVAALGSAAAAGLLAGGVLPVVKHVPGHGRAEADSHATLPRVSASLDELRAHDFPPFGALAGLPAAMSAHVVYEALDPLRPATLSPVVVADVIRGELGFDGLLFTDDLSMHALSGPFRQRAEAALAAGCDVVLHCNGDMAEMRAVAEGVPELAGDPLARAIRALALLVDEPEPFDVAEARDRLDRALAALA